MLEVRALLEADFRGSDVRLADRVAAAADDRAARLIVSHGEIHLLTAFFRDGEAAAAQVDLADNHGVNEAVESHVDRLDFNPETAADFFDQRDVEAVERGAFHVDKRIIIGRDAETKNAGRPDRCQIIRGAADRCRQTDDNQQNGKNKFSRHNHSSVNKSNFFKLYGKIRKKNAPISDNVTSVLPVAPNGLAAGRTKQMQHMMLRGKKLHLLGKTIKRNI